MNITLRGLGLLLAASVVLLVGCAVPGAYRGAPGGPGQAVPGARSPYDTRLQGTVDSVDARYSRLSIVPGVSRAGPRDRVQVRFDQRTRLLYQGREYPVEGLERGDVIRIDATQSGRELWARSIEVLRNVRDAGYDGGQGNDLRAAVVFVDPRARTIRLDGSGAGVAYVSYDARTTVEYQGRIYRPENLQRGDLVRIQVRRAGAGWLAERIFVERSVRP